MIPWRRVITGALVLAALLLVPLPASGGFDWDVSMALGYAAALVTLLLFIYPLRRARLPHRRLISITHHRRLGWLALILALAHVLLLLVRQPLTSRYLLPSGPLYMLIGLIATLLLALLVPTGLKVRAGLRQQALTKSAGEPSRFARPLHSGFSSVLLALIGLHIVGSGEIVDRATKVGAVCLLLVLVTVWSMVQPRWRGLRTPWLPVVLPAFAAVIALIAVPVPVARSRLLEPLLPLSSMPPLDFPHEAHREVNCIVCHHNMVDHTGEGACIACHRTSPAALTHSAEATFHTFCRDCHTELAEQGHKHGPTRACDACHQMATTVGSKQRGR